MVCFTGVNLGTYLSDGHDFLSLIERLSALKGLDRLRISSIEPTTIPEELLALMAEPSHPLMPYLHVPMQSGTDKILKLMRRRYDLGEMKGFFMQAKQQIPDLCLGTDLMVGFPNENDDDFAQTCQSFMEMPFSYCHVFTYSKDKEPRPAGWFKFPWRSEEQEAPTCVGCPPQRECLSMKRKKEENFVCYSKIPRMTSIAVTRIIT